MSEKPGKPKKSKYIETLDKTARIRYDAKLELISGLDPYEVPKKDWSADHRNLPGIAYPDIVNYLVYTQSAYSLADLKAYKALDSYNQFVCGWVKDVVHLTSNNKVLLRARVRHSQRMNETPLHPWIVSELDGSILAAHCNCMAGLGEACSHVGALLFWVEAAVRVRNSKTVTQEPAYWLLPTGIQKVGYNAVEYIDFASAKAKKRKLDESLTGKSPLTPKQMLRLPDVPDPTDNDCTAVLETLFKGQTRSAILTLKPTYAQHFVPTSLGDKFPRLISEYFDEQCVGMSPSVLVQHCTDKVFNKISVSASQAEQVEAETRRQAESKQWHRFRTGRVTASRMKAVCHTRMDKPSQSLVKAICYPHTSKLHTAGIRWGCDHEKTALSTYADQMRQSHENHQLTNCGLVMNPAYPFMGATPDSLVSCDCCGDGCVEVKCPCRKDFAEIDSRFCLEKVDEEGKLQLKRTHAYHYQVQTQLFVCNKDYCDFVVWTEGALHIERIEPDEEFWLSVELKAETFFKAAVLPEMVGKMFSRPQPATASVSTITPAPEAKASLADTCRAPFGLVSSTLLNRANIDSDDDNSDDVGVICICRRTYDATEGRVIGCDNENCLYKWLHYKCINLKRAPKGSWYCPECRDPSRVIQQS